jgi:hypothetical protein
VHRVVKVADKGWHRDHDDGQHASDHEPRCSLPPPHEQKDGKDHHHERLYGYGSAEKPAHPYPPPIECVHEGVEGECDGHGVFGMTPEHHDVPKQDALHHAEDGPAGSGYSKPLSHCIAGKDHHAGQHEDVRGQEN